MRGGCGGPGNRPCAGSGAVGDAVRRCPGSGLRHAGRVIPADRDQDHPRLLAADGAAGAEGGDGGPAHIAVFIDVQSHHHSTSRRGKDPRTGWPRWSSPSPHTQPCCGTWQRRRPSRVRGGIPAGEGIAAAPPGQPRFIGSGAGERGLVPEDLCLLPTATWNLRRMIKRIMTPQGVFFAVAACSRRSGGSPFNRQKS